MRWLPGRVCCAVLCWVGRWGVGVLPTSRRLQTWSFHCFLPKLTPFTTDSWGGTLPCRIRSAQMAAIKLTMARLSMRTSTCSPGQNSCSSALLALVQNLAWAIWRPHVEWPCAQIATHLLEEQTKSWITPEPPPLPPVVCTHLNASTVRHLPREVALQPALCFTAHGCILPVRGDRFSPRWRCAQHSRSPRALILHHVGAVLVLRVGVDAAPTSATTATVWVCAG